jgi:hypothetical protein
MRNAYKVLVGKHEEKKLLWRPRRRWKDTLSNKWSVRVWTAFIWIRVVATGGLM